MAEIFDDGWSNERVKLKTNIDKVYLTTSEEPTEDRIIVPQPIGYLRHEPVNPFDTPLALPEMSEKEKYAYYIGEDIKRLLTCDAAYFHPEWTKSKGCSTEHDIAARYGLELFYTFSDMVSIDEILPHKK